MDDAALTELLRDERERQFWLKPTGDPARQPGTDLVFCEPSVPVEFVKEPTEVRIGDALLLYRIKVSKLTCISVCESKPRKFTQQELEQEPWRERWPWFITVKNLTPEYGRVWNEFGLQPFPLVRAYNALHPNGRQRLGALQFGKDRLKITRSFAEFLIRRILALP